jgi:hypothetical protein
VNYTPLSSDVNGGFWFSAWAYATESFYSNGQTDGDDTISMIGITNSLSNGSTLVGMGCGGRDTITSNGGVVNVLIGDHSMINIAQASMDVIHKLGSIDSTSNGLIGTSGRGRYDDILTAITPINGRTVIIGGAGDDHITADVIAGDVTVCGDYCFCKSRFIFNSHLYFPSFVEHPYV